MSSTSRPLLIWNFSEDGEKKSLHRIGDGEMMAKIYHVEHFDQTSYRYYVGFSFQFYGMLFDYGLFSAKNKKILRDKYPLNFNDIVNASETVDNIMSEIGFKIINSNLNAFI
jgi:hypothetical protein